MSTKAQILGRLILGEPDEALTVRCLTDPELVRCATWVGHRTLVVERPEDGPAMPAVMVTAVTRT